MMKRILVAVDTTDASHFVLEAARGMAQSTGAKLRLLHVIPERAHGAAAPNIFEPAGDSYARIRDAEANLVRFQDEVPEEMRDGVCVEIGEPWSVICRVAHEYAPDSVVIGAHKHGIVRRALGTTAARVANHIDRPVFVIRPHAQEEKTKRKAKEEDSYELPADRFAMLKASTLAGAASGAIVGGVAGPPGIIMGGAMGAAIGVLAGSALDMADQRASAHDHELDDAIGVTKGPLGAREIASARLTAMEKAARDGTESAPPVLTEEARSLRETHAVLEDLYGALLLSYRDGDWREVDAQWSVFEPAIRTHMEFEEKQVFPVFRGIDPTAVTELLRDHEELRGVLSTLGVNIELHALPLGDAEELVRRLRSHGEREERLLYPWLEQGRERVAEKKLSA